jgi:hypothetical protein
MKSTNWRCRSTTYAEVSTELASHHDVQPVSRGGA